MVLHTSNTVSPPRSSVPHLLKKIRFSRFFRRRLGAHSGFTRFESLLAVLLVGIIAGVGVPKYVDYRDQNHFETCQHKLATIQLLLDVQTAGIVSPDSLLALSHAQLEQTLHQLLREFGGARCTLGQPCPDLCPAGGTLGVERTIMDGVPKYVVFCSEKSHGEDAATGFARSAEPAENSHRISLTE